MRYLLDTTLLIDHYHGKRSAVELVRELFSEPNDLYVCDAVVAEATSSGSDDELAAIRALIEALEYVSTDPDAAAWAGESRRRLRNTSPRHLGDALIAGVAWFNDAIVVTRNPARLRGPGGPRPRLRVTSQAVSRTSSGAWLVVYCRSRRWSLTDAALVAFTTRQAQRLTGRFATDWRPMHQTRQSPPSLEARIFGS